MIDNESEPGVDTSKIYDEPVLQARDTNKANPQKPKAANRQ